MLIINPDTYRTFIKPLLFRLPPETAQSVAHMALKQHQVWAGGIVSATGGRFAP